MSVEMTVFPSDKKQGPCDQVFSVEEAKKALAFHKKLDGYQPTPLRCLSALAVKLGVAGLYVKDESKRFGLNAFKGLGGSYALGRVIADKLGKDIDEVGEIPEGSFTFVTATDGNHGRGVAWAAKNLKQHAVVYMP